MMSVDEDDLRYVDPGFKVPWVHFDGHCRLATHLFVDSWDIMRRFSLDDPTLTHPEWSAVSRDAMLRHVVLPGMTRPQVLYAYGFPTQYGSRAAFMREPRWTWYQGTPLRYDVEFDGDTVTRTSGSPTGEDTAFIAK